MSKVVFFRSRLQLRQGRLLGLAQELREALDHLDCAVGQALGSAVSEDASDDALDRLEEALRATRAAFTAVAPAEALKEEGAH